MKKQKDTQSVIDYEGGPTIRVSLTCPLCSATHQHSIKMQEVEVWYKAEPEAYEPRDRELLLFCPEKRDYFKTTLRVHYPYHDSKIKGVDPR